MKDGRTEPAIRRLYDEFHDRRAKLIKELMPEGTRVWWTHGRHRQTGIVQDMSDLTGCVLVENLRTGKKRWREAVGLEIPMRLEIVE